MDTENAEAVCIRDKTLRDFITGIFRGFGVPEGHASIVSDTLVEANLRGVDSHGVDRMDFYIGQLKAGGIDGAAAGKVFSESGGCVLYDGRNGFGQVVADRCVANVLRVAAGTGLAMVVARNSQHFGAASYWADQIARSGCAGIVMSTAGSGVPPFGGKTPRLGTNPIAMAVPGGRWLLDMATTTSAHGRLGVAAAKNLDQIPASWGFVDSEGRPTTDRREAERGWSVPFGGYKGTGLAVMAEILSAGLSGGPMSIDAPSGRNLADPLQTSHMFLAVDPKRFLKPGEFEVRMGRLIELIKSSEPAAGHNEVLVAGEVEWRTQAKRLKEGIPIPRSLWDRLAALAARAKVVPPRPDAAP
jgi:LDH2 family malate/lactate/ureidoglycolate dehydrogenase